MELSEFVSRVASVLTEGGIPHFVTGSLATIAYGEPRLTLDVDLVAALTTENLDRFLASFPEPDFYVSRAAAGEAIKSHGQFNIIHIPSGLKLDLFIPAQTEFNRSRLDRCRPVPIGTGAPVLVASPEDAIIKKLEYFRQGGSEKHLRDIAGVLKTQCERIDFNYIQAWVERLGLQSQWHQAKNL
jgi:hypothetical protein